MIIGALTAVGRPDSLGWLCFAGVCVGVGMSLVLDEFELILHLQDVYRNGEGQLSVEAVTLTAACLGLMLVGFSSFGIRGASEIERSDRLGGLHRRAAFTRQPGHPGARGGRAAPAQDPDR